MNPLEQASIYRNVSETHRPRPRREIEILPKSDKAAGLMKPGKPGVCLDCLSRICEHVIPPPTRMLSPHQVQILRALSRGLCNKEIGQHLHLTEGTVKVYLSVLFKILGFTSRLEAGLWARDHAELLDRPAQPISA